MIKTALNKKLNKTGVVKFTQVASGIGSAKPIAVSINDKTAKAFSERELRALDNDLKKDIKPISIPTNRVRPTAELLKSALADKKQQESTATPFLIPSQPSLLGQIFENSKSPTSPKIGNAQAERVANAAAATSTPSPFSGPKADRKEAERVADATIPVEPTSPSSGPKADRKEAEKIQNAVAPVVASSRPVDSNSETPATTTVVVDQPKPPQENVDKSILFSAPLAPNQEKFSGVVPLSQQEKPKILFVVSENVKNGYAKNCIFYINKLPKDKYKVDYYKIYRKDMLKDVDYKLIATIYLPVLDTEKLAYIGSYIKDDSANNLFTFIDKDLKTNTSYCYKIEVKYILKSDEEKIKDKQLMDAVRAITSNPEYTEELLRSAPELQGSPIPTSGLTSQPRTEDGLLDRGFLGNRIDSSAPGSTSGGSSTGTSGGTSTGTGGTPSYTGVGGTGLTGGGTGGGLIGGSGIGGIR